MVSIDTKSTGDPKGNIGSIGDNTAYLTEDAGTTKWIGNSAYLTEVVQTTTISGAATTVTKLPSMQIIGPVDDNGLPTGAFDFVMTPMLVSQIQNLSDALCNDEKACSADFPPRVEALLEAEGDILSKRGAAEYIVGGVAVVAALPAVQDFFSRIARTVSACSIMTHLSL